LFLDVAGVANCRAAKIEKPRHTGSRNSSSISLSLGILSFRAIPSIICNERHRGGRKKDEVWRRDDGCKTLPFHGQMFFSFDRLPEWETRLNRSMPTKPQLRRTPLTAWGTHPRRKGRL
jgi:hypothetical protein